MAKSRFEYVRSFEVEDKIEPSVWILIKVELQKLQTFIDLHYNGQLFNSPIHKLSVKAAKTVMNEWKDIAFGYGFSSNFYFVLKKDSTIYRRRGSKWLTNVSSLFVAAFTNNLLQDLSPSRLESLVYADSRIYVFPRAQNLRDFLMAQQLECHHFNLNQTTAHQLHKRGNASHDEIDIRVRNMADGEKNELLFSEFKINYNNEPIVRRKGTILIRKTTSSDSNNGSRSFISDVHKDFSKEEFWKQDFHTQEEVQMKNLHLPHESFMRKSFILPHAWLVVRIDGKGFHKFSEKHTFDKPNDKRSLQLMNSSAQEVMRKFPSIVISYGQSDEYSFVFNRYGHREKEGNSLISRIVTIFSVSFVKNWKNEFSTELLYPPCFDGRVILYPTNSSLQDYLSWRQADCHINNMFNTCFWFLVNRSHLTRFEAQEKLSGTYSIDKVNILWTEFNFDYSKEDPFYGKGTVLFRSSDASEQSNLVLEHIDIIQSAFWDAHPWILGEELRVKQLEEEEEPF